MTDYKDSNGKTIDVSSTSLNIPQENSAVSTLPSEEEKRVIGKPFEKGNKGGPGRPKGSRNKDLELLEKMNSVGYDPVYSLLKLRRKKQYNKDDKMRMDIDFKFLDKMYANKKEVESTHTEDKAITITLNYQHMDDSLLLDAQKEFGIIEGEIIDKDIACLPNDDDDDENE